MTPELLDELERLEKAATPKEWVERVHWREYQSASDVGPAMESVVSAGPIYLVESHRKPWEWPEKVRADSKLIVALRNAAPSLFQSLRSLMAENEALKAQFEDMNTQRENAIEAYGQLRFEQTSGKVCPACGDSYANKEERDSLQAQLKATQDNLRVAVDVLSDIVGGLSEKGPRVLAAEAIAKLKEIK